MVKARNITANRRKKGNRPLRKVTYIYTNGETEEAYFKDIRKFCRFSKEIYIIQSSELPRDKLVEKVIKEITSKDKDSIDKVFIVFDADIEPKGQISNPSAIKHQVNRAYEMAKAEEKRRRIPFIPILSNECFELWYLLHFEDVPLSTKTHRDELNKKLKAHIQDYDKGKAGYFELTSKDLKSAIKRAKKMSEQYNSHTPPADKNPYTNVYELVEELAKRAGKEYIDLD